MEKGQLRCDANVSIRPRGQEALGTKVEVKNMNSFRSVQRAIEFEIERQTEVLETGGRIVQETRGYVDATGITVSQRSKEEANDYRYFPEPDLPPLVIDAALLDDIRKRTPELPDARQARFVAQYGLTEDEARTLTDSRERAEDFEAAVVAAGEGLARPVALWFIGDVAKHLNERGQEAELRETSVTPAHIADLVGLAERNEITSTTAKEVLSIAFETGEMPSAIVEARGLKAVSDEGAIDEIVARVIAANPKPVEDYRGGKQSAAGFLVGQVMREAKGRADANTVTDLLRKRLDA
jgi:aspartyl-tRNA(Asn)/glutamyl-tRNA(Gln) amidotransferase subunit B